MTKINLSKNLICFLRTYGSVSSSNFYVEFSLFRKDEIIIVEVINLQAALESFANNVIPENYPYLDKLGNPVNKTVTYKLYNALPKIKKTDFQLKKNRKHNITIDKLIKLRNDIVHLKPVSNTNTGYKSVYRDLLNFDFAKALLSVKTFINFYEPNLIEECICENDFYFYSGTKIK